MIPGEEEWAINFVAPRIMPVLPRLFGKRLPEE